MIQLYITKKKNSTQIRIIEKRVRSILTLGNNFFPVKKNEKFLHIEYKQTNLINNNNSTIVIPRKGKAKGSKTKTTDG